MNQNKQEDIKKLTLSDKLEENVSEIKKQLGDSFDLIYKYLELKSDDNKKNLKISFFMINGLVDQNLVNESIIESIVQNYKTIINQVDDKNLIDVFNDYIVTISEVKIANNFLELYKNLLSGDTILLIDGQNKYFQIGSRKYPERSIEEPKTHISIMGPKDSMTENLITNTALIRLKLKNPNLWMKAMTIGSFTNTNVVVCYLKDVADEGLVNEVMKRLESIKLDNILDVTYIGSAIKDGQATLFPTIHLNERPDAIVSNILEGKVAIISDGSPFAIVVPAVFIQFIQATEDFYKKASLSTFFRGLRMMGFLFAMFLPAIYVTLTFHHSELIPFPLLVKIAAQREGLPFPSWIEAVLLCLLYDLLREASLRMPTALGNTISIVGALVLGESSIQAGIVSPILLIVVSVTAISTLSVPNYTMQVATIVLKYVFLLLAAALGLFGIILGIYALLLHLAGLRSFGVNYLAPYFANSGASGFDQIIRKPINKIFGCRGNFNTKYPQ